MIEIRGGAREQEYSFGQCQEKTKQKHVSRLSKQIKSCCKIKYIQCRVTIYTSMERYITYHCNGISYDTKK